MKKSATCDCSWVADLLLWTSQGLNLGPPDYESVALTNWATSPVLCVKAGAKIRKKVKSEEWKVKNLLPRPNFYLFFVNLTLGQGTFVRESIRKNGFSFAHLIVLWPLVKVGFTSEIKDLESLLQPEGMECGVAMIRDGYNAGIE